MTAKPKPQPQQPRSPDPKPGLEGAHLTHKQASDLVRRLQAEIYRNQRLLRAVVEYYGSAEDQLYEALRAKYVAEAEGRAFEEAHPPLELKPQKTAKARR